jgi:hypothetical protein
MSETVEPQAEHELEPDDDLDGCELDFTEQPTSDLEADGLVAPPADSMKAQREDDWEREERS